MIASLIDHRGDAVAVSPPVLLRKAQTRPFQLGTTQHSITFTAKPPRDVSLYLVIMSRPVSLMVLIT